MGKACHIFHQNILGRADQLGLAPGDQAVGAALMGASAGPGTANTSRFWSRASRAVISVPLCSAASTAATPADRPLRMRLRMGKRHPSGGVPGGFSDRMAPAAATSS